MTRTLGWLSGTSLVGLAVLGLAVLLTGCESQKETAPNKQVSGPPPAAAQHEEHSGGGSSAAGHAEEGPHHGQLVELGKEEYHAEVVHDEANGSVTIYLLDSSAKNAVPSDATELTISLKHDGQPEQFTLAASPAEGDPEGKASRFASTEKELGDDLDAEGADPRLTVKINGKSYSGAMTHSHGEHSHKQ